MMRQLEESTQKLESDYGSLLRLIESRDWSGALKLLPAIEAEAKELEQRAKLAQVAYPPVMAQIDEDVRKGIGRQDEELVPISTGLNSLVADLRIKKKVIEQNTDEALAQARDKYNQALAAIVESRWADALDLLKAIEYPQEILEDTRQKEAILRKITSGEPPKR